MTGSTCSRALRRHVIRRYEQVSHAHIKKELHREVVRAIPATMIFRLKRKNNRLTSNVALLFPHHDQSCFGAMLSLQTLAHVGKVRGKFVSTFFLSFRRCCRGDFSQRTIRVDAQRGIPDEQPPFEMRSRHA